MDKNERLQLMKQKIEALQLQRKKIDSKHEEIADCTLPFISHITNSINNNESEVKKEVKTVEISVQTDDVNEFELGAVKEAVITYDIGIQTDEYDGKHEIMEDGHLPSLDLIEQQVSTSDITETKEDKEVVEKDVFAFGNVVSAEDYATLKKETFSLQETIEAAALKSSSHQIAGDGKISMYLSISPKVAIDSTSEARVISSDVLGNLLVTVIHLVTKYVKSSLVQITHVSSGEVLDTVLFQGQNVVRSKFIDNPNSKITSVVLSCYTGKLILYELRTVKINNSFQVERNIVSTNYHHYPVLSIIIPKFNDHSILAASTNGQLKLISTLDLSLKEDDDVKIIPIPRTDLSYSTEQTKKDNKYYQHLLIMSLYDELSIISMLLLPSDPSSIYLGCEDGFIYKVCQLPLKGDNKGCYKISEGNNGFIPNFTSNVDDASLFHEGPITGMVACAGIDDLFFSYSIDGDCIFWDAVSNSRVSVIECDDAIIKAQWINENGSFYVALLTSFTFQIKSLRFSRDTQNNWQLNEDETSKDIVILPSDTPLKEFSSFEVICNEDACILVLCGTASTIYCYVIDNL